MCKLVPMRYMLHPDEVDANHDGVITSSELQVAMGRSGVGRLGGGVRVRVRVTVRVRVRGSDRVRVSIRCRRRGRRRGRVRVRVRGRVMQLLPTTLRCRFFN